MFVGVSVYVGMYARRKCQIEAFPVRWKSNGLVD